MNTYLLLKTLHIFSPTILFGTGMGIAFFMWRSWFTDNLHEKLYAVRNTVLADYCFTFPATVIQPVTGFWLLNVAGYDPMSLWLLATYSIYAIVGLCWLPVVWIQIQLKKVIQVSIENHAPLPERYHRLFKIWFLLGWPSFIGLVIVFFLMVFKPV